MPRRIVVSMLIATLIGLFSIGHSEGSVDGGILVNPFVDPALEACVRDAVNIPEGDLPAETLAEIINLECQDMGIADISGIEFCTNMVSLSLWENEIVDISPLSGLSALTTLQLGNNLIADTSPLSGLTGLTSLGLSVNRIVDISPLAALSSLLWLNLDANLIVDVSPLGGLTGLEWLTAERNMISDLSPLEALAAGGCNVYTQYQHYPPADIEASLNTIQTRGQDRSWTNLISAGTRENGRLVPVVGADHGIELRYELGETQHRIIPEFSGKFVSHDDLIVLEGMSAGPVTVGEITSRGPSICSGDYAETCDLSIGIKTGSRLPLEDELPGYAAPVFTATLTIRRSPGSAPSSALDMVFDTANDEMLPFVLASPNQYDAGSCLFMATTGAAEILMNQQVPLEEIQYLGDTDLSERFLMNAIDYVPSFAWVWWLSDLVYTYNYLGGSMLDRDYPMAAELVGEDIQVFYSWTNDLPADWQDQLVETPGFERTTVFIDPARADNSKWNVALMDGTTVEQIKYELRTKNAPVIIVYNHFLYWHADIIVGYDDTVDTGGCPMVTSSMDYFAQHGAQDLAAKIQDHMEELGGCTDTGIFYVRDSIYEGEAEEEMYNYGGPYPFSAKYSKRIIERSYNWVKFLANHAYAVHRAESALDNDMDGHTIWNDCNDYDGTIYPDAHETIGDGVDSNCDGKDCFIATAFLETALP